MTSIFIPIQVLDYVSYYDASNRHKVPSERKIAKLAEAGGDQIYVDHDWRDLLITMLDFNQNGAIGQKEFRYLSTCWLLPLRLKEPGEAHVRYQHEVRRLERSLMLRSIMNETFDEIHRISSDGRLSQHEMIAQATKLGVTEVEAKRIFSALDQDGSGMLDCGEVEEVS